MPAVILVTNLLGTGAYPGPTTNAFARAGYPLVEGKRLPVGKAKLEGRQSKDVLSPPPVHEGLTRPSRCSG
jgi:hypothetical protein